MGKKRKFVDVFKSSQKCSACSQLQNENCPQCTNVGAPPTELATPVQAAKRSFLHQILRHGLNVQTKSSSPTVAAASALTSNIEQKPNGLFQYFKIAKFKDGSNYIKGKEVAETFLLDVISSATPENPNQPEQTSTDLTKSVSIVALEDLTSSRKSISTITDTDTLCGSQSIISLNTSSSDDGSIIKLPTPLSPSLLSPCDNFPLLKPLFFEVPTSSEPIFIGRNWLFTEMERILFNQSSHKSRGIIITGNEGSGKTSILLQLVEHSCFGRQTRQYAPLNGSPISLLASKLVAYHFCQVDYRTTCLVPEFVHSIASQLCQAPQLTCYRDFLAENLTVQNLLSKLHCLMNPSEAFVKGILDPLNYLHRSGKIPNCSYLLVIDSICEAEFHRTDEPRDTISTFLTKHILKFPTWLKIVVTTRSSQQDIVNLIPFQEINLNGDLHSRDLLDYINVRVKRSPAIRANISCSSSGRLGLFQRYLHKVSKGNFLFLKLTLDFIEQGSIQIKSSNFKVLPNTLADLFLLQCNHLFPTLQSFTKIEPILSTCLSALNPLSLLEIYHSVNSLESSENIHWDDFMASIGSLSSLLYPRSDGTYMFFHSSFGEWLIHREENPELFRKHKLFLCDTRLGHAAISFRLSRIEAPLSPEKTLELGHHILKAHIYKGIQGKTRESIASKDLQAFWLASSSQDLSKTLGHPSNIYYPNFKVTRLLLQAGASPNQLTDLYGMAPILSVAAAEGQVNLASILLEFGADIDEVNLDGDSALHLACQNGHLEMVSMLIENGGSLEQLNNESQCPFVKAVLNAKLDIMNHLIKLMEDPSTAIRRSLVAICLKECSGIELDLLDKLLKKLCTANLDSPDGIYGETPLTAAVRAGRDDVVNIILNRGGNPGAPNLNSIPPLNLAAKGGHSAIVKTLLLAGSSVDSTDFHKRTPLIEAVVEAQFEIVNLLVGHGADLELEDDEGMNALSWACFRGFSDIAQYVLAYGMDPNHADKLGRTPLDLASHCGSEGIAHLLLDHGALLERTDLHGVRPLDRAVGSGHSGLVKFLLRSGAKINLTTWTMATGKSDIMYVTAGLLLLNKLLNEGLILRKSGLIRDAVRRFQYVLGKIPLVESTGEMREDYRQLRLEILLQLSRCKRNLKEPVDSVTLASESIKLDPNSYKTWLARAKAYHCLRALPESHRDCSRAIQLAPNNEVKKELLIFKENLTKECNRSVSPCQFSTNSLKLFKTVTGNRSGTLKPKASTSNCLSERKSIAF